MSPTSPVRAAATVVVLLALVGLGTLRATGPAAADAGPQVQLSLDGVHWAHAVTRPLFDPEVRWVPGDVRTERFFVRSTTEEPGDLTVDVERVRRDVLLDTGYLDVAARTGAGAWTTISSGGTHRLLTRDDLRAGRDVPVTVRVSMDPAAPNGTMVLGTDLDFRVTLVDADTSGSPGGSGGSDGADGSDGSDPTTAGGTLPATGSDTPPWLPPLGLLLLGTGTFLVLLRRAPLDLESPT